MSINFSLEGKVAWVTGASFGIGFAIAEAFAASGAKIAFNSTNSKHVENGIEAFKKKGIDAKGYVCDVTDEVAVKECVEKIVNDFCFAMCRCCGIAW